MVLNPVYGGDSVGVVNGGHFTRGVYYCPREDTMIKVSMEHEDEIKRLKDSNAALLKACKEMVAYLRNNYYVIHELNPEYGIWHRAMATIDQIKEETP